MNILTCTNLVCGYSSALFSPLNIRVAAGEILAIMGRSGVGKTTLLTTILGMNQPLEGKVLVDGVDVHSLNFNQLAKLRSTKIGTIFQNGELISGYNALDNVTLPKLLWNKNDKTAVTEASSLLAQLHVDEKTMAEQLSGGERQRTALARALINHPKLILADELTGALDYELRDETIELLVNQVKKRNCAMLLVTHDPTIAKKADRAIHLKRPFKDL